MAGLGAYFNESSITFPCFLWREPQNILFQIGNTCLCFSFLSPNDNYGILIFHSVLIVGFLLFSIWAWNVVCALDIFAWNFAYLMINIGQVLHIIYQMRVVHFPPELEQIYLALFEPMHVSRLLFKKLVSSDVAQIVTLQPEEAYAVQNTTRTDRLGLLISGKIHVFSDNHLLHPITEKQFLDSPEYEATHTGSEEKFKVTIVAATRCRCMVWQRESLDYLFVKETYLAHIMSILIARDITTKIYAMNEKIVTDKGSHLDIRLPSITSFITSCATHGSLTAPGSTRCNSVPHPDAEGDVRNQEEGADSVFDSKEKLVTEGNSVISHQCSSQENSSSSQPDESYSAIAETWPVST